ncbi:hypothetical protein SESBI_15542 [Sesbania bispinosa]|nr:hypothetical protein SESBI_15542 [Sesbania bispinosa]
MNADNANKDHDCMVVSNVPRVDLEETSKSLHGDWLNVTRRKRGKSGIKAGHFQSGDKKDNGLNNQSAALDMDPNDENGKTSTSASIIAGVDQVYVQQARSWVRKKRPRMGQQPNVDVQKLLDNATKARVNMSERVTTRIEKGVDGLQIGAMQPNKLGSEIKKTDEDKETSAGKEKKFDHPFNICTTMNVEVVGPNRLRIMYEEEPPDNRNSSIAREGIARWTRWIGVPMVLLRVWTWKPRQKSLV